MLKIRRLYYITHIDNIASILNRGILCHKKVETERIKFTPIYNDEIVSIRKDIKLADGRDLWDFVNLYFQPRNAMLYRVIHCSSPKKKHKNTLKPSEKKLTKNSGQLKMVLKES